MSQSRSPLTAHDLFILPNTPLFVKAIDRPHHPIYISTSMTRKSSVIFFTALFVFLLGVSAYGQCHLIVAHSDFEAEHDEQLLDCPNIYLSLSNGNFSHRPFSRSLDFIDFASAIDSHSQILSLSAPFRDKLSPPHYSVQDLYLWMGVLRF